MRQMMSRADHVGTPVEAMVAEPRPLRSATIAVTLLATLELLLWTVSTDTSALPRAVRSPLHATLVVVMFGGAVAADLGRGGRWQLLGLLLVMAAAATKGVLTLGVAMPPLTPVQAAGVHLGPAVLFVMAAVALVLMAAARRRSRLGTPGA